MTPGEDRLDRAPEAPPAPPPPPAAPAGVSAAVGPRLSLRIAVRHTNEDHFNSAPFVFGGPFDDIAQANAKLAEAYAEFTKEAGYTAQVEELLDVGDDTSEWRPVADVAAAAEAAIPDDARVGAAEFREPGRAV